MYQNANILIFLCIFSTVYTHVCAEYQEKNLQKTDTTSVCVHESQGVSQSLQTQSHLASKDANTE